MSVCCTVVYKWVIVMNGIKYEFRDIISLHLHEKRFWVVMVCHSKMIYAILLYKYFKNKKECSNRYTNKINLKLI